MRIPKTALTAILFVVILAGAAPLSAAEFQFGLTFSPGLPRGEFRDNQDRTIWGGTMSLAFRPSRSPLLIGMAVSFGTYDTDRWETWLGLTDPDVLMDVRTSNDLVAWSVFLRLQPERGFLRPYLDVFAGLHVLTTDTRFGDGDDEGDGSFHFNNASDTAFAFGAGAGVQFPLFRILRRDRRIAGSIDLDFGVRYAKGGRADYLIESGTSGVFDERSSRTDLLTLSAGLSFSF